jgi:hypothetical protein
MMTKSNGNSLRNACICFDTSFCHLSPRPMSPSAAKRYDPGFFGSRSTSFGGGTVIAAVEG